MARVMLGTDSNREGKSPWGPLVAKFRISDAFCSIIVRQHHPELSGADGAPDTTPPVKGEGDVRGLEGPVSVSLTRR